MCVSAASVDLVGQGELSTAGEYVHGARQGLRKDGFRLKNLYYATLFGMSRGNAAFIQNS